MGDSEKYKNQVLELLELIREKRKEKGITQQQVAEVLGMSQTAYKDIEKGKNALKMTHLLAISEILEIDIFDLYNKKNEDEETLLPSSLNDFETLAVSYLKQNESINDIQSQNELIKKQNEAQSQEIANLKAQNEEIKSMLQQLLIEKTSKPEPIEIESEVEPLTESEPLTKENDNIEDVEEIQDTEYIENTDNQEKEEI